jgi:hypothetical protein
MPGTRNQQQRATQAIDLKREQLPQPPDPEAAMTRMLKQFERFAKSNPLLTEPLLKRLEAIAEEHAPPDAMRRLTAKQAALVAGISERQIRTLRFQNCLGETIDGKSRFSKKECNQYRISWRFPGPKCKNLKNTS